MSKSPFIRAVLDGKLDISAYVVFFEYEDCTDKDDKLTLRLSGVPKDLFDNPAFVEEASLQVQWGFIEGVSRTITYAVKDVEPDYRAGDIGCVINAYDAGNTMKQTEKSIVWEKVSAIDIAGQIAKKHGLKLVTEKNDLTIGYRSVPQGNMNDFDFLQYLASRETSGEYQSFVKGKKLFFKKRPYGKPATKKYVYNDPESGIISIRPKHKGSQMSGGAGETTVAGFDMFNGQYIESKANPKGNTFTNLGKKVWSYTADAVDLGAKFLTGKKYAGGFDTQLGADSAAAKLQIGAADKDMECVMETEGEPGAKADEIITIGGLAHRHSGNYYRKVVKHTFAGDSLKCSHELTKDGSALGTSKSSVNANSANNTEGGAGNNKKTIYEYDANATQISPK